MAGLDVKPENAAGMGDEAERGADVPPNLLDPSTSTSRALITLNTR